MVSHWGRQVPYLVPSVSLSLLSLVKLGNYTIWKQLYKNSQISKSNSLPQIFKHHWVRKELQSIKKSLLLLMRFYVLFCFALFCILYLLFPLSHPSSSSLVLLFFQISAQSPFIKLFLIFPSYRFSLFSILNTLTCCLFLLRSIHRSCNIFLTLQTISSWEDKDCVHFAYFATSSPGILPGTLWWMLNKYLLDDWMYE